jgi:hypothetical protein
MDTRLWHDQNPSYLQEPQTILDARFQMQEAWKAYNARIDAALDDARMEGRDKFSRTELDAMAQLQLAWIEARKAYDTAFEQAYCYHDWVDETTGGLHYNGNEVDDDLVSVTRCKLCLKIRED